MNSAPKEVNSKNLPQVDVLPALVDAPSSEALAEPSWINQLWKMSS